MIAPRHALRRQNGAKRKARAAQKGEKGGGKCDQEKHHLHDIGSQCGAQTAPRGVDETNDGNDQDGRGTAAVMQCIEDETHHKQVRKNL